MLIAHIGLTPIFDCSSIAHVSVANELFLKGYGIYPIMWYVKVHLSQTYY